VLPELKGIEVGEHRDHGGERTVVARVRGEDA
jgi:hypothetical protein